MQPNIVWVVLLRLWMGCRMQRQPDSPDVTLIHCAEIRAEIYCAEHYRKQHYKQHYKQHWRTRSC
jgi:hypothetical protein